MTPGPPRGATALDEPQLLAGLPPVRLVAPEEVARRARNSGIFVVLDDDPTGTQTVSQVPVVTTWEPDDLRWAVRQGCTGFFVLTNTRSLGHDDATSRNDAVTRALALVANEESVRVVIASRSDSTLRGHFAIETDVLATLVKTHLGRPVDGILVVPAYIEGGRLTINSMHWARTNLGMVPVGQTEFAADATFGYRSSDLRDYIDEKTKGRWKALQIARITLGDIREGGVEQVVHLLLRLQDAQPIVVDATSDDDLRLVALAAMEAERLGKTLLYRIGPSFVRARLGQEAPTPLTGTKLATLCRACASSSAANRQGAGGLVVVGSHVPRTTAQLERLARDPGLTHVELDVRQLVGSRAPARLLDALVDRVAAALKRQTVVVSTSREPVTASDAEASLELARQASTGLVELVSAVLRRVTPRFVVAKGGITSSDLATRALGIRRAWVRGTLLPGIVSLWEPAEGSACRIPFVVFAGNVGSEGSLTDVVAALGEATCRY